MSAPAAAGVVIVGGGLAGSLLALELRALGVAVALIDAGSCGGSDGGDGGDSAGGGGSGATALSYGAVATWAAPPTPLGRLMRQAPRRWAELQGRAGSVGWRRRWLRLHGEGGLRWLGALPLPCGQVDALRFAAALPGVLERAGVQRRQARVQRLERVQPNGGDHWELELADCDGQGAAAIEAAAVVLAAGAHCCDLWPGLSERLWVSWAGVIELERWPAGYRRGQLVLPGSFLRPALERRAPELEREQWVVDPGLVPRGEGALVGQISLVRPARQAGEPPDAALMERRLRAGLERFDPALARAAGTYRQAPVAFCTDGQPLVGPVADAPGLWQCTGFSAAFAQVPALTPALAAAIAQDLSRSWADRSLTTPPPDQCG